MDSRGNQESLTLTLVGRPLQALAFNWSEMGNSCMVLSRAMTPSGVGVHRIAPVAGMRIDYKGQERELGGRLLQQPRQGIMVVWGVAVI